MADLGRVCYQQLYPQRDDRMKMIAEGTSYLEQALALDPENVEAHCWLARIYGFVGLSEKALELSRRAVELGPNNPEAHMSLSERFREMGFYEAAIAENNQTIMSDSLFLWAYLYKASYLLALGDADTALDTVKQAEGVEPTSPFVTFWCSGILLSSAETCHKPRLSGVALCRWIPRVRARLRSARSRWRWLPQERARLKKEDA